MFSLKMVSVMFFALMFAGQLSAQELVTNGGFENDGTDWNLYVHTDGGGDATVSYPSTDAPEGSKYASVSIVTVTDISQVQLQLPLFTAESNVQYLLTFKARGNGYIKVTSQSDAPDYLVKESFTQDITSDWTTYSQTFSSDVDGANALRINFWLGSAAGTYDFDSVSLVKVIPNGIRSTLASATNQPSSLSIRKAGEGYALRLPGSVSTGAYSITLYSLSGQLEKTITGSRNGNNEIVISANILNGAHIVRYTDNNGTIAKRMCLAR